MRTRDTAALILVALALTFSALAIGGAPRWAACGAALLCVASAIPYITSRRTASRPSPLLYPIAAAAALTAFQLVPLPRAIAEQLVPAKLALVTDNALAWGDPLPTWTVASYDPPATLVELAKLCGYLALAWTCVRLSSNRRARRWLAVTVVGGATLVAVVTLAHHAAGLTKIYGIIDTRTQLPLIGPILNPNHQSSLFGIAVPIALALALTSHRLVRVGWTFAALTLVMAILLGASRGGLIGLVAGLVVAITLYTVQRRAGTADEHRGVPLAVSLPAGIVAVCVVTLLAVVAAGDVTHELAKTSVDDIDAPGSRYQIWGAASSLLAQNHWLGVGKGGFEPAFTALAPSPEATYSHAESSYYQAALDWGLPGALIVAMALIATSRIAWRRWRQGPIEAGVVGGLVALAIHDIADFSIELPAIATTAIAAAAILLPDRLGTATDPAGKRASAVALNTLALRAGVGVVGIAIIAIAASPIGRSARADAARVAAIRDLEARAAAARDAAERHPASYALAGRASEALFARGDVRAVKLAGRALAFSPRHGGLHHLVARMLARSQRPEQAAGAFAAAVRWSRDPRPVLDDLLATYADPERAAAALPLDARAGERAMRMLWAERALVLAYGARLTAEHPTDAMLQSLLAQAAVEAGDPTLATQAAAAAWELNPTARHGALYGRALALAGDPGAATRILQEAFESTRGTAAAERLEVLFALADIQTSTGALTAAKATLEKAGSVANGNRDLEIAVHQRLATIEDRLGNKNQADWERARVRELGGP